MAPYTSVMSPRAVVPAEQADVIHLANHSLGEDVPDESDRVEVAEVEAHGEDPVRGKRRVGHPPRTLDAVRHRLLAQDVEPEREGAAGRLLVEMDRGGDHHRIHRMPEERLQVGLGRGGPSRGTGQVADHVAHRRQARPG
jgi:hypothetical protein